MSFLFNVCEPSWSGLSAIFHLYRCSGNCSSEQLFLQTQTPDFHEAVEGGTRATTTTSCKHGTIHHCGLVCREWQQLVEAMSTGTRVKMIWMDTTALQEQLRSTLQRALGVLCMVLEVACHERLITTLARIQKVIKAMSAKPVSLAQFTEFVRELKAMQASQGEVLADVDVITVRSP